MGLLQEKRAPFSDWRRLGAVIVHVNWVWVLLFTGTVCNGSCNTPVNATGGFFYFVSCKFFIRINWLCSKPDQGYLEPSFNRSITVRLFLKNSFMGF